MAPPFGPTAGLRTDDALRLRKSTGDSVGDVTVFCHPCMCKIPGPRRRPKPRRDLPDSVTRKQYDERKAIGMPVQLECEKSLESREI